MKERYTLLVLSLLLVVMLYGITGVLGASNWTAPTRTFPDEGSVMAPIDVGRIEQKREGKITFETSSNIATTSLDISKLDLLIGDASNSNFFSPYTEDGPKFRSDTPITINANGFGLVLPNIVNPDGNADAKVSGNLIFDSTTKKLKLFVNDMWKTIDGAGSLWTKDGNGNIYTSGPVMISGAELVVTGDIKINEPKTKNFYYFPKYSETTYYVEDNAIASLPSGWPKERARYHFNLIKLGTTKEEANAYLLAHNLKSLPCDKSDSVLECRSAQWDAFVAYSDSEEERVDVTHLNASNENPISGYIGMIYTKYPHEYDYVPSAVPNQYETLNANSHVPRYSCDIDLSSECAVFAGPTGYLAAPPPESGWPAEVYDWIKINDYESEKFTRTPLTREQMGFEKDAISFPTKFAPISVSVSSPEFNKTVTKTEVLGNYSFCALGKIAVSPFGRASCHVYYSLNESTWKLDVGAWVNSIDCSVNCF